MTSRSLTLRVNDLKIKKIIVLFVVCCLLFNSCSPKNNPVNRGNGAIDTDGVLDFVVKKKRENKYLVNPKSKTWRGAFFITSLLAYIVGNVIVLHTTNRRFFNDKFLGTIIRFGLGAVGGEVATALISGTVNKLNSGDFMSGAGLGLKYGAWCLVPVGGLFLIRKSYHSVFHPGPAPEGNITNDIDRLLGIIPLGPAPFKLPLYQPFSYYVKRDNIEVAFNNFTTEHTGEEDAIIFYKDLNKAASTAHDCEKHVLAYHKHYFNHPQEEGNNYSFTSDTKENSSVMGRDDTDKISHIMNATYPYNTPYYSALSVTSLKFTHEFSFFSHQFSCKDAFFAPSSFAAYDSPSTDTLFQLKPSLLVGPNPDFSNLESINNGENLLYYNIILLRLFRHSGEVHDTFYKTLIERAESAPDRWSAIDAYPIGMQDYSDYIKKFTEHKNAKKEISDFQCRLLYVASFTAKKGIPKNMHDVLIKRKFILEQE